MSNLQRLTRMKKVLRITNPNVYAAYVNVEDNGELITRKGWVLLWSPELTQGTAWEKKWRDTVYIERIPDYTPYRLIFVWLLAVVSLPCALGNLHVREDCREG